MAVADGAAGARRAAAMLGIAACAETTSSSMSEDAAKVDVKLSFRHSFQPNRLINVHAQVKSGRSYRLRSSSSSHLRLGIDRETLAALSGTGTPGLVVWVPPPPLSRLYWYAVDPRRSVKSGVEVSRDQFVRPSIRYDLTRLAEYAAWTPLLATQTMAVLPDAAVHQRAKRAYAALKSGGCCHPFIGSLAVTRLAWRHITRRSKTKRRRTLALRAVPHLKFFLQRAPDRYAWTQKPLVRFGKEIRDVKFLTFWYRAALTIAGERYSLLVRVKEEISYPAGWQERPLGTADVRQAVTLASWWCKKDKD
jgi:hypothetical protein